MYTQEDEQRDFELRMASGNNLLQTLSQHAGTMSLVRGERDISLTSVCVIKTYNHNYTHISHCSMDAHITYIHTITIHYVIL